MRIQDLRPLLLVQTPRNEVLKVSTVYSDTEVSAELVYPMPGRTTVRFCTADDVERWRVASNNMVAKYELAWGLR